MPTPLTNATKILFTLPPTPKREQKLTDYQQSVEVWTKQVHTTLKQLHEAVQQLQKAAS